MKTPQNFFKYLQGSWKIKKTFSDVGLAVGFADFELHSDGLLHYKENVEINQAWHGRAEHILKLEDNKLYMQFMGQKKYHPITFANNEAVSLYLCEMDLYKTHYKTKNENSFCSFCQVTGGKDFEITTEFNRIIS